MKKFIYPKENDHGNERGDPGGEAEEAIEKVRKMPDEPKRRVKKPVVKKEE